MDDAMFTLVISKWHEYADYSLHMKDWRPVAATVGVMKEMIRMLDLVLKRSGSLTKEGQHELRTARILLYKVFYDQTEKGLLYFSCSLIKSFNRYKQPRSLLSDLVEITHIVLRILDDFAKAGESLRVLTKVRGGWKNMSMPANKLSKKSQIEGAEEIADEARAGERAPQTDLDSPDSPSHVGVTTKSSGLETFGGEEITGKAFVADGEEHPQGQFAVESRKESVTGIPEQDDDEEEDNFGSSPPGDNDDYDSDRVKWNGTKEVNLNTFAAVGKLANNAVVRNYCWLLKFYSSNRPAINHYIVRMLQRICEDYMLEPMLYEISILQTFYSILTNKQVQAAEDHRFVNAFISKLVRRLFKKLETQPFLFLEMIFWKSRAECQDIFADYMIHYLREETRGSAKNWKRCDIADALGDDEEEAPPPMKEDSAKVGSATFSEEDDVDAPEGNTFSEAQVVQMRELFERYKNDKQPAEHIALELDPSGKYTAAQVLRKLQSLGLLKKKTGSGGDLNNKLGGGVALQSQTKKLKKRRTDVRSDVALKKSGLFSEAQDQALRELFTRHGSGKNVTKVITQNMGGDFTIAQVSRRLRRLGLVKPRPRTVLSSLHAIIIDDEEDDDIEEAADRNEETSAPKRKVSTVDDLFDSDDDLPSFRMIGPSRQEGAPEANQNGDKRSGKRRVNTVHISDSDDDSNSGGTIGASLKEEVSDADQNEEKSTQEGREKNVDSFDSDDDFLLLRMIGASRKEASDTYEKGEKHPRKKRVSTVHANDSDDDLPSGGMIGASRQKGVSKADQNEEKSLQEGRENTVDLFDRDDDFLPLRMIGALRQEGAPDAAQNGEKHRRRKRASTVHISDNEDSPPRCDDWSITEGRSFRRRPK